MNKKNQKGFAMIEVLISLILIAVGLMGVTGMLNMAHHNTASSYYYSQANIIIENLFESMRANRNALLISSSAYDASLLNTCKTENINTGNVSEQDLNRFICQLRFVLPDASASVSFNGQTQIATVIIKWDESRRKKAEEIKDKFETFTLQGRI